MILAIEQTDYCETTVLVSSSAEKAQQLADRHDAERGITYDEYHDGAVYIGTPDAYHLEYVETTAEYDKAVLCEKPSRRPSNVPNGWSRPPRTAISR